jgi:uncharacterized RDD family membrane protein YckC
MQSSSLVSGTTVPQMNSPEPQGFGLRSSSRIFNLITGTARLGVSASALVAGEITSRSVKLARFVLPAGIAEGSLDAIERQVDRRQNEARRSEQQSLDDMSKAAESALNRVVIEIVDRLDMQQLIEHVVPRIDLPEVIDEIDLAGIVREGTKGLGEETLDSGRAGLMAVDQWSSRLVDKILRRKEPRDLTITSERYPEAAVPEVVTPVNRYRDIRNARAQQLQGLRAGFFSRALASGTDVLLVLCIYVTGVVAASIAWDLLFSKSVSVSVPPHWLNELAVWILLVLYLTAGWASAGRTLGKQIMGLRVICSDGSRLRLLRAFLRAVLCATFFPVLLLALVNRRNRGIEDVAFRTVVAYDWLPKGIEPLTMAPGDAQIPIEVRDVSVPITPSRGLRRGTS